MITAKQDIISRLKQQVLDMQGFKPGVNAQAVDFGLGPIDASFPGGVFPTAVIHEFLAGNLEDAAASGGFITTLLSRLMQNEAICFWLSASRKVFPPSLAAFGINPDKIIFVDLDQERDVLWATEEALKCESLGAVVSELNDLTFAQSRRLQLVIEKSRVTAFIVRKVTDKMSASMASARWKISAMPSEPDHGMPGLGFARWQVELVKVKNGIPGSWELEYSDGRLQHISSQGHQITKIREAI